MSIFNLRYIIHAHFAKNWTIVKNQHTNTNNVFTIKFHNRSILMFKLTKLNVICWACICCSVLVRRSLHMRVWRPLNIIKCIYLKLGPKCTLCIMNLEFTTNIYVENLCWDAKDAWPTDCMCGMHRKIFMCAVIKQIPKHGHIL
jgi:hypothetical protein